MRGIALLVVMLIGIVLAAFAIPPQFGSTSPTGSRQRRDPRMVRMEKEQLKNLNKERYKKLKADTDKLLDIASDLKKHVDNADKNVLSMEVVKRAKEIEELAKSVRTGMTENIGPMIP